MKRASALLRPGLLATGALAGLFGAHALNYWLLISDPVRRQALLHATGHAWVPQIESVAIACALASVLGALISGSQRRPVPSLRRTAATVAAAQSLGFIALEFGERIFVGAPLHHLTPLLLAVGVGLQVAMGIAIAIATTLLARAGARIACAFAGGVPPAAAPIVVRLAPGVAAAASRHLRSITDPVRGPPVLFAP